MACVFAVIWRCFLFFLTQNSTPMATQKSKKRAATTIPIMTPMASFLVVLRVVLLVVSMALAATVGRLMLVVPPKSSTAVWKTVEMLLSEFAAHP